MGRGRGLRNHGTGRTVLRKPIGKEKLNACSEICRKALRRWMRLALVPPLAFSVLVVTSGTGADDAPVSCKKGPK